MESGSAWAVCSPVSPRWRANSWRRVILSSSKGIVICVMVTLVHVIVVRAMLRRKIRERTPALVRLARLGAVEEVAQRGEAVVYHLLLAVAWPLVQILAALWA